MKIAIATDAWAPQVNGVVNTLMRTRDELVAQGHDVRMLTPQNRRTFACPTYPEIRLALFPGRSIRRELVEFDPDCIHIATEGPIGFATRRFCVRTSRPFTTAYHTQLPEYVRARAPIPVRLTVALLRWFHSQSACLMVPTKSIKDLLQQRGFKRVELWSRGVNTELFSPQPKACYDLPRPIWINLGRVAVEKNIEAFLDLDLPGSKVVIGDGPDKERLAAKYPDCHFLGYKFGADLSNHLAGADVFVFPSKTDTFGLVILEAMACGLPVAAYPVTGPADIVYPEVTGALDEELQTACEAALGIDPTACRHFAESKSWSHSTSQFISHLVRATGIQPARTQSLAHETK